MNLKNDVQDILEWFTLAIATLTGLLTARKTVDSMVLAGDISNVVKMYLEVFSTVVPERAIDPFPKNFFSRISWVKRNVAWLNIVGLAFSGTNPFEAAKVEAASVASKWNFYKKEA